MDSTPTKQEPVTQGCNNEVLTFDNNLNSICILEGINLDVILDKLIVRYNAGATLVHNAGPHNQKFLRSQSLRVTVTEGIPPFHL